MSPLPPGAPLAKIQPMNGTSPQNAAFNTMNQRNNSLANLTKAVSGGGRRHRHRLRLRRYKGGFVNPPNKPMYPESGSGDQTASGISDKLSVIGSQTYANRAYDVKAQQGGRHRRKTRRLRRGRGHSSRRRFTRSSRNH